MFRRLALSKCVPLPSCVHASQFCRFHIPLRLSSVDPGRRVRSFAGLSGTAAEPLEPSGPPAPIVNPRPRPAADLRNRPLSFTDRYSWERFTGGGAGGGGGVGGGSGRKWSDDPWKRAWERWQEWFRLNPYKGILLSLTVFYMAMSTLLNSIHPPEQPNKLPAYGPLPLPDECILTVDLRHEPTEKPTRRAFGLPPITQHKLLNALHRAATDDRIVGLLANVSESEPTLSITKAHEIAQQVLKFRENKKFAYAFADSFGSSIAPYYLASTFSKILLQPSGDVGFSGLHISIPFLYGMMQKLQIQPQFLKRKEYKTMPNMLSEPRLTPEHREEMQSVLDCLYLHILHGIATARDMPYATVHELIAKGPYFGIQAFSAGLIDAYTYQDVLPDICKLRAGCPNAKLIRLSTYLQTMEFEEKRNERARYWWFERWFRSGPLDRGIPKIALIYAVGSIVSASTMGGVAVCDSNALSNALRVAARDPDVNVIVLRVDSGGGSYVASDTVYATIKEIQQQHDVNVVVSMGSTAASGAYLISAAADHIMANPQTLTGSIGVFGGKVALRGLLEENLGIHVDELQTGGENADINSIVKPYTATHLRKMNEAMDRVYDEFVTKVAEGRKLTKEQVEAVAKGRVWTGMQAQNFGLVDSIGTLHDAIELARRMIPAERMTIPAKVVVYPRPKSLWQIIKEASAPMLSLDAEEDDEPLFTPLQATGPDMNDMSYIEDVVTSTFHMQQQIHTLTQRMQLQVPTLMDTVLTSMSRKNKPTDDAKMNDVYIW